METVLSCNVLFVFILLRAGLSEVLDSEKIEFCNNLECDQEEKKRVCGIRVEDEQTTYTIFPNECTLLKYGCQVDSEKAYGIINMEYCTKIAPADNLDLNIDTVKGCNDCLNETEPQQVCGIRKDGEGYRIRIFDNECKLLKHNCEQNVTFQITDLYICNGIKINKDNETKNEVDESNNKMDQDSEKDISNDNDKKIKHNVKSKIKRLFVVDGSMLERNNINASIDDFFAASHVLDMPMQEMQHLNESIRRMLIKNAGPIVVYKPRVVIPKNVSEDRYHQPTLKTCFHKCPKKCPDTYAPVCGIPGTIAREPTLLFQNHCLMDVAQCKMRWENKSWTAASSGYEESTFIFCFGDELNNLYRFMPLIKTLQHMGRLKLKGKYNYKLKNMRFFNNYLRRDPKLMG